MHWLRPARMHASAIRSTWLVLILLGLRPQWPTLLTLLMFPVLLVRTVEWRGKPVFVVRRTPAMLESLARHDECLADPFSRLDAESFYGALHLQRILQDARTIVDAAIAPTSDS
jgi:hypothetical protein